MISRFCLLSEMLFNEEMVQVNSLAKDIFLLKHNNSYKTRLILFNAPKVAEALKNGIKATDAIVATISYMNIGKYQDVAAISSVAATKGFGPTIYEIALADADWLKPDYEVSDDAENVWKKFFQRRDIEKKRLKEPVHPDQRDVLNYAYHLKTPSFNLKKLINNGDKMIKTMALDLRLKEEVLIQIIIEAAQQLFTDRYAAHLAESTIPLDEVAMSVSDAESLKLALFINEKEQELVLYNPNKFYKLVEIIDKTDNYPKEIGQNNVIVGCISVNLRHNKEVSNVTSIAAEPGFGPLMYELAMSVFGPITNDEEGGTSIEATSVWKKFLSKSEDPKGNVEKKRRKIPPFGDLTKIIPGITNYKFGIKEPHDFKQLVKNHEKIISQLFFDKNWILDILETEANEYFKLRYLKRKR